MPPAPGQEFSRGSAVQVFAFALSLTLHCALFLGLMLGRTFSAAQPSEPPNLLEQWQGDSVEIETPGPPPAAPPATPSDESPSATGEASEPAQAASLEPAPPPTRAPKPTHGAATSPVRSQKRGRARAASDNEPVASAASAGETPTANGAGAFGSQGLPPGVRRLASAFTRAIPAATHADPSFSELPPGEVGTIRVALSVDAAGRIGDVRTFKSRPGEPEPPAALRRMLDRTLLLLRAGQFALAERAGPGTERLVIHVRLSDGPETADASGFQQGFSAPAAARPGSAYFVLNSGRRFDASVRVIPAGRE